MAATTSNVYIHVIEDVVTNVRDNFTNLSGPGEDVLKEFQALWELKMMQCGAICGPIERSSIPRPVAGVSGTPVHDLNVPYEGTEEYETPTAEILFPPTPLQTPIQTPLPGPVEHSTYPLPPGNNDFPSVPGSGVTADVKPGRPSPYMQPPSPWMNQRPLGVDVNIAYVEGRDEVERVMSHHPMTQDFFMSSSGKRKRDDFAPHFHNGYLPQQDGAGDAMPESFQMEISEGSNSWNRHDRITANREMLPAHVTMPSSGIPQQDGPIPDAYDNLYPYQGVASEDYNTVNTPAIQEFQAGTPAVGIQSDIGDEDEPLNENDDDDDFDDVDQEEPNTHHLVLAQFEKVTRTKSRWKCTLKDGIMHINNKDVLFTKAIGEFEF